MARLWDDVRFAIRLLARQPAFTCTVLLALALGIGANSAIFSIVHSVLWRPLPYPSPDRLCIIWSRDLPKEQLRQWLSADDLLDLQKPTTSFGSVSGTFEYTGTMTGQGDPLRTALLLVSPNYFETLGVQPFLGRGFTTDEGRLGNHHVAVLTHSFWKRQYGSDPGVIGRTIMLDDEPHTIVGVMPNLEGEYRRNEIFIPLTYSPDELTARTARYLTGVARLKDGVTPAQAEQELAALAGRFAAERPQTNTGITYYLISLQDDIAGTSKQALLVLAAAVVIVLLITCANLASLLLVRAAGRQKEVAVRTALGASRVRVVRQLLTESVIISLAGGLLGLAVAYWAIRMIQTYGPAAMPRLNQAALDAPVLLFTLAVAVCTGLVFGAAPAFYTLHLSLNTVLRQESRGTAGGVSKSRSRAFLVIFEVALASVLLICAGLLVRSLWNLNRVDPGFRSESVLTLRTTLPEARYETQDRQAAYVHAALERVRSVPGVVNAAAATELPFMGTNWKAHVGIEGRPTASGALPDKIAYSVVSSGYFATLSIPMRKGRTFDARDTREAPRVVVVNEAFARRYFPGEDPIGKRLKVEVSRYKFDGEIVGVAGNVRQVKLSEPARPAVYVPFDQQPWNYLAFAIRTASNPLAMAPAIRRAYYEVDPQQPVDKVMTLQRMMDNVSSQERLAMSLLLVFACLSVLLAGIGLYGLLAYSVAQRVREIGIRVALGASSTAILGLIIRQGILLTVFGLLAGMLVAPLASNALQGLLYETAGWDIPTYAAVAGLLLLVSFMACLLPSRRAMRIDPSNSLRAD